MIYDKEQIRARVPMMELCREAGMVFRRGGAGIWVASCPAHAERSASFTIYERTPEHAYCFGCGWKGDIFTFWMLRNGGTFAESVEALARIAGVTGTAGEGAAVPVPVCARVAERRGETLEERGRPVLPVMRRLKEGEVAELAGLRGISADGVRLADAHNRVGYAMWPVDGEGRADSRSRRSWVVTDDARWTAQFRRMDGCRYDQRGGGKGIKAWSTRNIGWMIGGGEIEGRRAAGDGSGRGGVRVMLVEGGADMLAAYHFLAELADAGVSPLQLPVVGCLFGASARLLPESLDLLAGCRVRIFADNDEPREVTTGKGSRVVRAGMEGAARWQEQLDRAGCAVDVVDLASLERPEVKDLNDLARAGYGEVDVEGLFVF